MHPESVSPARDTYMTASSLVNRGPGGGFIRAEGTSRDFHWRRGRLERRSRDMRIRRSFLRLFYCWYFASLAMIFLCGTLACIPPKNNGGDGPHRPGNLLAGGLVVSVHLVLTIIFGVAGWTAFRERASAIMRRRGWMVVASLLSLLISTGFPCFIGMPRA
jgi:hypothetical protein